MFLIVDLRHSVLISTYKIVDYFLLDSLHYGFLSLCSISEGLHLLLVAFSYFNTCLDVLLAVTRRGYCLVLEEWYLQWAWEVI